MASHKPPLTRAIQGEVLRLKAERKLSQKELGDLIRREDGTPTPQVTVSKLLRGKLGLDMAERVLSSLCLSREAVLERLEQGEYDAFLEAQAELPSEPPLTPAAQLEAQLTDIDSKIQALYSELERVRAAQIALTQHEDVSHVRSLEPPEPPAFRSRLRKKT